MKIAPFPELIAYAEEEARALYGALPPMSPQRTPRAVRRMSTTTEPGWVVVGAETTTWEEQAPEWREAIVSAQVALLTDLSRPASRDAVCRLVSLKVGWLPCRVMTAIHLGGVQYDDLLRRTGARDPVDSAPDTRLAAIVAALWGGA